MISRSAEKRCRATARTPGHVLDNIVEEGEAGLPPWLPACTLPRREIRGHDFLLRCDELLHGAEVFLHQRLARIGGRCRWWVAGYWVVDWWLGAGCGLGALIRQ